MTKDQLKPGEIIKYDDKMMSTSIELILEVDWQSETFSYKAHTFHATGSMTANLFTDKWFQCLPYERLTTDFTLL